MSSITYPEEVVASIYRLTGGQPFSNIISLHHLGLFKREAGEAELFSGEFRAFLSKKLG